MRGKTLKNTKSLKFLNLGVLGICVLDETLEEKYSFSVPLF